MIAPSVCPDASSNPTTPDSQRRQKSKVAATRGWAGRRSITQPLYAAFSACFDNDVVVWDVGCGDGQGTAQLLTEGRQVVGIERDADLLARAKRAVPNAAFALSPSHAASGAPDVIVLVDALGSIPDPRALLLTLGGLAKPTATLLLAEPRAHIGQQLRVPMQRAFSDADLRDLLFATGWSLVNDYDVAHSFVVVSAKPADRDLTALLVGADDTIEPTNLEQRLIPWLEQGSADMKARLHTYLAQAAMGAGNGDRASHHYLTALELVPDLPSALSGFAQLMLACGNTADALRLTARCLEAHPTHVPALRLWLHVAGQTDFSEQLRTCQALADLTPADPEVQTALAQLHAGCGNADLAIQDLELLRCYQTQPNADLSITLAWLLDAVGRRADAQVEARLAATLAPGFGEVEELLAALDVSVPHTAPLP